MTGNELIDRTMLDSLLETVGGDFAFLAELVQEYFDDSPQQFSAMQQALNTGNTEGFRRAAHSLKSNSANFGATGLAQLCKQLEDLGKAGNLDSASELLVQANDEYEQVVKALEQIIGEG
jgi:HPt (histidine-containing phosphotransfer) domain-containing protein